MYVLRMLTLRRDENKRNTVRTSFIPINRNGSLHKFYYNITGVNHNWDNVCIEGIFITDK